MPAVTVTGATATQSSPFLPHGWPKLTPLHTAPDIHPIRFRLALRPVPGGGAYSARQIPSWI